MIEYVVSDDVVVTATDDPAPARCFCITRGLRAYHASRPIALLIEAVRAESTLVGIVARLNARDGARPVNAATVQAILHGQLMVQGLIAQRGAAAALPARRTSSLLLSRTLLNARVVGWLARPLSVLMLPSVALLSSAIAIAAIMLWGAGWLALGRPGLQWVPTLWQSLALYGVLFACLLFHECGHAAATHACGARPAEIGVGLYLVFPVLYCNVTPSWRLSRWQRVTVNLGGVYFQLLATALLVPFQLASHSELLALAIASNLLTMVMNMNPFFRFDGYWLFSDFFRLPNLHALSRRWLCDRCSGLVLALARRRGRASGAAPPPLALVLYSLGALVFFGSFLVTLLGDAWVLLAHLAASVQQGLDGHRVWNLDGHVSVGEVMQAGYSVLCFVILGFAVASVPRGVRALHGEWRQAVPKSG